MTEHTPPETDPETEPETPPAPVTPPRPPVRIPSSEQSFYKISQDLDTLGEGIEALDESINAIQGAIEELLDVTRGVEPIELKKENILVPNDSTFRYITFGEDVEQDANGWINIYEYETVSMIASVDPQDYMSSSDTLPLNFDYNVSTFEAFKEAIVAAQPGATIYVEPGTYMIDEQIVLNNPVSIYGAGDATILQAGENTSSTLGFDILFAIKSSDVRLQGFKLIVNSMPSTSYHRCFFMAANYTTQSLPVVGAAPINGVVPSATRALNQGTIENIQFVNLTVDTNRQANLFSAGLTNNVRVQNCTFNAVAANTTDNAGSPIVGSFQGIGGDWLFQGCNFNLTPLVPSNLYRWQRIFTLNTANYWAVLNNVAGYQIKQSTCRFTVRNVNVQHKTFALVDIAPDANETYLLDPDEGVEFCLDNVTCHVESNNPSIISSAPDRLYGSPVVIRGTYYNPGGANGPNTRVPYLLDCVKDISISNSNITGGERGLVFARYLIEAGYPNYTPVETPPIMLRSGSELPIHTENNIFNRVNPQKLVEGAAGPSPYNQVVDFFGDGTLIYLNANAGLTYATADNTPGEGVQSPADISLAGRGTFELRTEYRLVQDGLALEFVPPTSIDILTETQKEIINPRIPAVLVGVLEIRFLIRAIDRLGNSLISLFGTIR